MQPRIVFKQPDSQQLSVSILRAGRAPLIGALHRAVLALGIVVASYQAQADEGELLERMVLERRDGGEVDDALEEEARKAVLLIVEGESK